jgi:hypothetical protein
LPRLGINDRHLPLKIAVPTKLDSPHHWKFPRSTPIRDLHTAFNRPYEYDLTTKLCRQEADFIQNHENEHVRSRGQGEARRRKYKKLKLGGGKAYDRSND